MRPDVSAVTRSFDYLVPAELADAVRVGAIVRVPLHGRRVRGWVVADDVVPEAEGERLLPLAAVLSAGPTAEVVACCEWAAWRFAGPVSAMLRAASPPNIVALERDGVHDLAVYPIADSPLGDATPTDSSVVVWPPAADDVALIRALLAPAGSTVVVVPDTTRMESLADALARDGRHVVVLSGVSSGASRTQAWSEARRGACVVVGGRVAVLAPVPDLQAIVLLDDADEAHKEERMPTWHARDVAVERARVSGARLTIVSPAPTVEAVASVGRVVRPGHGVDFDGWPSLRVVDLREEPPGTGLLTAQLGDALHRAREAGGRALCVMNRKGRARLLSCRTCRELARCEACGAAVGQLEIGELSCARCGEARPVVCLACGGAAFRTVRPAVGAVREGVAGLVPRSVVVEVDASTREVPAADVYVGTEAVLHRVPRGAPVRLVAFVEMDQELLAARYRAAEQALWLLVRGARLVGPRRGGGTILVQTRMPGHEVLVAAGAADPSVVTDAEAVRRHALGFPPFGGLAVVSGTPDAVAEACRLLDGTVRVLGPSGGRALLRAASVEALCDALAATDLTGARAIGRLRIEVDPLRI